MRSQDAGGVVAISLRVLVPDGLRHYIFSCAPPFISLISRYA